MFPHNIGSRLSDARCQGLWSEDEDARLEDLVKHYDTSWALIAQRMGTRSADRRTLSFSSLTNCFPN